MGVLVGAASDPLRGDDILRVGLYGGVLGAGLGVPMGVYLVGTNMRGDGGLGWTFLGSMAGSGLTLVLAILARDDVLPVGVPVLAGLVLPVAGAVLGYESSSQLRAPPARARRHVLPYLTVVGDAGQAGLCGTF